MKSIKTITGRIIDYNNPDPSQICLGDIAYALSRMPRWVTHTPNLLSVGDHCLRVAEQLEKAGNPPKVVLAGLLHDAAEAYMGDIAAPLKDLLAKYTQIENKLLGVILKRFGLRAKLPKAVVAADMADREVERNLMLYTMYVTYTSDDRIDTTNHNFIVKAMYLLTKIKKGV